ncbi:MAG: lipid kinase [Candidatus Saccharibacteria bacterium]|jgi:YegS/Rv2252/BmrU family lipid kinase|nr:lipid kinase [Candidatus Saccharibacteria bacterium]
MTSELLINSKAGLLKDVLTPAQVREKLRGLKLNPKLTVAEDDQTIQAFVKRVRREQPDVVLVAGGDGTAATVIKGLRDTPVVFGLIPTGSLNNIAQSIGLGDELDEAVDAINQGHVARMDLGEVNGEVFVESVGFGLLAKIMDRVGEQDSKKEVMKVLGNTLAEIVTTEPIRVNLHADDRHIEQLTVWLTVTNTGRAAAAVVDPTSNIHDHQLELIYCEPLEGAEIASYVTAVVRNSHIKKPKFHRMRTREVNIKLTEETVVHVDGELRNWSEVHIKVLPGAVRVLAP